MIESENLRTASLYINNQLLSRGLLRDGNGIDFAQPGDTDTEVAETMSRIMAVVNDLILRRDRDAEHRESLSATLRTLRAESLRQANDIQRLQEKYSDAQRKVGLSEAAETALRANLKTSEATVHRLKEEAARTKTLVAQTRASCANEVRKRDRQIEGLKKAVTEAGRARGAGRSTGITSINVVGETGLEAEHGGPTFDEDDEQNHDLRTETNAFLAELAKGLSEENEGLLQLVRKTTEHLKEMSGWDVANGNPMENGDGHAMVLAAHPADMSLEVDAVLDHLRTILTNPSFVPIEEVVVREDEIHRLRDGWEKMETRWKEAVHLIDGWRKRMQASGRAVNVEELKMGLRLSPVKVRNVEETSHGYALRLAAVLEDEEVDTSQLQDDEGSLDLALRPEADDDDSDTSSIFDHNVGVDDFDVEEPNVEILQQSVMLPSPPLPLPPQLTPLRDSYTAANRGDRPHNRKPPKGFPTISEGTNRDFVEDEPPLPPPHAENPQQSPHKKPILSLRTVPPEEAAKVELPPSAHVSTPDNSLGSLPFNKAADERTSKNSAASARAQARPAPTTKRRESPRKNDPAKKETTRREAIRKETVRKEATKKEAMKRKETEEVKPTTKPPPKSRSTRPPITRGRSESRPDDKTAHLAKPQRATSATSATSVRSAGTTKSANRSANKSANAEPSMPPPPPPHGAVPSPAPSPSRSPKRVNSRLPLPRPGCNNNNVLPAPQQSPLNMAAITAKLAASERDADAARVRAKLKAARLGKGVSLPPPGTASTASTTPTEPEPERNTGALSTRSETDSAAGTASTSASTSDGAPSSTTTTRDEDADELGFSPPRKAQQPPPQPLPQQQQQKQKNSGGGEADLGRSPVRKRERRTSKAASRRRSTLDSRELDALIQGGNVTVER
ncbi:Afadin and alpha-actinin-binding-domain-containing protein [Chaetomium fimeti]|uniref:Afadin and alpha-actinin-binding-domain-containing protein n=1 Tax=Chaetomium fimeti TaxID=1854472 RepID=A0AAE0LXL1_9PEZI|nr:Afadin and alpha-actinin-binding-domain-containing protein [Chaetomium fimeti]